MEYMLMPLKRYADFSGRSRRSEFWMWVVFQILIGIGFSAVILVIGGAAALSGDPGQMLAMGGAAMLIYVLYLLVGLAFLIPNFAVTIRRLHDTNRSGWWMMIFWGPYLLMIAATFMAGASASGGADPAMTIGIAGILMLAMLVGGLVLLVFLFLEGTRGPNQYGADPKGQDSGQVFA